MKLKLGTRGSNLARTQSTTIARALEAAGHEVELVIIRTSGDDSTAASFGSIGPQGVFVREIEQALVDGRVDLAVHSFKDLPTASPGELVIAAVPARHDVADLLIAQVDALDLSRAVLLPLKQGMRVGTASARRRVWLEHFRPDLDVVSLRGNVPTRLKRLEERHYDAILLAASGVGRLRDAGDLLEPSLAGLVVNRLDPERFVPAPAQGALAVQCRRDDADVRAALAPLDDAASRLAVETERTALALAEGGCDTAFGAYAQATAAGMCLIAMLERHGAVKTARAEAADSDGLPARVFDAFAEAGRHA
jgi:hydroxymethylbilane synthase